MNLPIEWKSMNVSINERDIFYSFDAFKDCLSLFKCRTWVMIVFCAHIEEIWHYNPFHISIL